MKPTSACSFGGKLMIWVEIILLLIKYGPAIITLVQEIIELIRKRVEQRRLAGRLGPALAAEIEEQYRAELAAAVDHWKHNRDRGRLRALRDRLRGECGFAQVAS